MSVTDAPPQTASVGRRRFAFALFEPVPIAPLVQFRLAMGLILLWEAYRYLSLGWPRGLFLETPVLFQFSGFEWVRPLPDRLHLAVFQALAPLAFCFAVGLCYRLAAGLLFLGWAYAFLLDQSLYLNHLYLVTVVTGVMACLPAQRALSIDALLRPSLRTDTVPRWTVGLLRIQVGLVYFFGGVAKLNADWLSGVPMQMMLVARGDLIGQPAGEPAIALAFAYGGLLFDLLIVPALWWKRTRLVALLAAAGFHLTNHLIFQIGIFPWFMLAATLILWPPFPLSLLTFGRIYGSLAAVGMALTLAAGREVTPVEWVAATVVGAALAFPPPELRRLDAALPAGPPEPIGTPRVRPAVLAALAIYLGWQVLLPLRHWVYPGDVNWTEEGHKWSWHMKLRIKQPESANFFVVDANGRTVGRYEAKWRPDRTDPNRESYDLLPIQDPVGLGFSLGPKQAQTMSTRPEMILHFAHLLADEDRGKVAGPVKVTANVLVSLDGRLPQYLIDPEADLAAVHDRLWPPADWILPLDAEPPKLRRIDIAEWFKGRPPGEDGAGAEEL